MRDTKLAKNPRERKRLFVFTVQDRDLARFGAGFDELLDRFCNTISFYIRRTIT